MTRRQAILFTATAAATATTTYAQQQQPYTLPKLPYAYDALEPLIDAKTMEIHHSKHHQAYVDNLNKATEGKSRPPLDQLLKQPNLPAAIRNNGGGHANHSLFWEILGKPGTQPSGALKSAIGDLAEFEAKLKTAGLGVFGSGWVWVVTDGKSKLAIETSPNQDSPWMAGKTPLFGIDVWEHAYYLKYQNRRADYLTAVMKALNWDAIGKRYKDLA
ncbi:superoxide dismutase [Bryobacterales bacterium F-183]|nr:superoxide dismutase [Bryobacterales bacterium F-183]